MSIHRIQQTFARLRRDRACGLFPYLTAGFPNVPTCRALAETALSVGADGFEIGVPFSDPLADGATMQRTNARALAAGATLETALDLARAIRQQSAAAPVVLMSYYNPIRQRGEARFAEDVRTVDADGVIVPDLPPEEAHELQRALAELDLALVPLLAPTSPTARIRAIAALEPAFVYCVALVGVTGARAELSAALGEFLGRIRAETAAPLVVGFGISQPRHVEHLADLGADGAIVASALADLVERAADPLTAAREYLSEIKRASLSRARAAPAPASP